jgi:hypothetical protein
MKTPYNPKFILKMANNLLKKLVLLLSVLYAVACHAITVTNYCFTWCSVVIKAILNTCFGSIICYIGKFYFENLLNCHFALFEENDMKILLRTGF